MKHRQKKLLATTDYWDNIILGAEHSFSRMHLDSLHRYLRSIGVTRHQWMYNTGLNFYDPHTTGFDLLAEAAASAHAHGLEFYAVIKPFEGGGYGDTFPHSLPLPKQPMYVQDMRGIYPIVRPFVAEHPHLCLKRRPGSVSARGPVAALCLIKQDDRPTRVKQEHLTIWTSDKNNNFKQYHGPRIFRESVAWRPGFPKSRFCRMLHLEGLQLAADQKYILIRCALADGAGDFTNERGSLLELLDPQGQVIPTIVTSGQVTFSSLYIKYKQQLWDRTVRCFQSPEWQCLFDHPDDAEKYFQDFFAFDERQKLTDLYTLDKTGAIAVACGKPDYMFGNLHPIYPEARRHWLDMLRFCLDRGVDGVNIRTSNHTRSPEAWEYGFNEPVIIAAGGRTDYPTIRRINGDAYTLFMREARELVTSYGKSLTVHVYAQMLMPDDRSAQLCYIPPNFDWQWETWIREIADDLEFRGAWTLRPWNLRQALETFYSVTRACEKPFYFQGNMKELGFNGPHHFTAAEIEMVNKNPDINGLVLYETANFTKLNQDGITGSADLAALLKKKWAPK